MSLPSTNANLCRLLIQPSDEWITTGMRYHSSNARRSKFSVAESHFGLCAPKAWVRMLST